jgi:aldehyde:ferredoxin oxidoreductase
VDTEDRAALIDSLILCKFLRGVFGDLYAESAELLQRVTGWEVSAAELRTTTRRIVTAKKLYNIREGWDRAEDTLPPRFLREGLAAGPDAEARLPRERLQAMIAAYYQARGWDTEGRVPQALAQDLGLQDLIELRPGPYG